MPATDLKDMDTRQRELERDVSNTAKAAPLQLDLLMAIERRLFWIQMAMIAVFVLLACLYFARN